MSQPLRADALSVKEAAIVLGVHEMTVRDWIKAHKLRAVRVGRLIRVRRAWIAEFYENHPYRTNSTA